MANSLKSNTNQHKILEDEVLKLKLALYSEGYSCAKGWYYNVIKKDTNNIIGSCEFHPNGEDTNLGNIGYSIDENYRNNGYAKRAVELLILMASDLGMDKVTIATSPINIASIKVIKSFNGVFTEYSQIAKTSRLHKESSGVNKYIINVDDVKKVK